MPISGVDILNVTIFPSSEINGDSCLLQAEKRRVVATATNVRKCFLIIFNDIYLVCFI